MLVYLVTNLINGKRYVGQTRKSLSERWKLHCRKSNNCFHLHRAIKKYGKENFSIEQIVEIPNQRLADEFESEYIQRYCSRTPNGYNLTAGGSVPQHSEETRKKMSSAHQGKPCPWVSERVWTLEQREQCRTRMIGNKRLQGKHPSEETRRKISESMKKRRKEDFWSTAKITDSRMGRQTYDAVRHRNMKTDSIDF
jgi:group I intron endonuclease